MDKVKVDLSKHIALIQADAEPPHDTDFTEFIEIGHDSNGVHFFNGKEKYISNGKLLYPSNDLVLNILGEDCIVVKHLVYKMIDDEVYGQVALYSSERMNCYQYTYKEEKLNYEAIPSNKFKMKSAIKAYL